MVDASVGRSYMGYRSLLEDNARMLKSEVYILVFSFYLRFCVL